MTEKKTSRTTQEYQAGVFIFAFRTTIPIHEGTWALLVMYLKRALLVKVTPLHIIGPSVNARTCKLCAPSFTIRSLHDMRWANTISPPKKAIECNVFKTRHMSTHRHQEQACPRGNRSIRFTARGSAFCRHVTWRHDCSIHAPRKKTRVLRVTFRIITR